MRITDISCSDDVVMNTRDILNPEQDVSVENYPLILVEHNIATWRHIRIPWQRGHLTSLNNSLLFTFTLFYPLACHNFTAVSKAGCVSLFCYYHVTWHWATYAMMGYLLSPLALSSQTPSWSSPSLGKQTVLSLCLMGDVLQWRPSRVIDWSQWDNDFMKRILSAS